MSLPIFEDIRKRERLLRAMDEINKDWGKLTIHFGSFNKAKDLVAWDIASLGMHRELELIEMYDEALTVEGAFQ